MLASELSINGGEDAAEVECRFQYRRDRLEENWVLMMLKSSLRQQSLNNKTPKYSIATISGTVAQIEQDP